MPLPKLLLCVLMLIGSTSLSVRHAHAGGDRAHAHGFGAAAVCPPVDAVGGRHEHVLLCGVEVYHHPEPDQPDAPGQDSTPPQVSVGYGDACDQRTEVATDVLAVGILHIDAAPVLVRPPVGYVPATVSPLCHAARHLRSGVSRL